MGKTTKLGLIVLVVLLAASVTLTTVAAAGYSKPQPGGEIDSVACHPWQYGNECCGPQPAQPYWVKWRICTECHWEGNTYVCTPPYVEKKCTTLACPQ